MARRGAERKQREEAEAHLVSSYLAEYYPDQLVLERVRLGAIEPSVPGVEYTEQELAMVGSFRRWADAIVVTNTALVLIEGAIRPSLGDPSTLKGYAKRIPLTPELAQWKHLPLRLELVGAIFDPEVKALCQEDNIKYVLYTTPETERYIATLFPRFQQSPRSAGFE